MDELTTQLGTLASAVRGLHDALLDSTREPQECMAMLDGVTQLAHQALQRTLALRAELQHWHDYALATLAEQQMQAAGLLEAGPGPTDEVH